MVQWFLLDVVAVMYSTFLDLSEFTQRKLLIWLVNCNDLHMKRTMGSRWLQN